MKYLKIIIILTAFLSTSFIEQFRSNDTSDAIIRLLKETSVPVSKKYKYIVVNEVMSCQMCIEYTKTTINKFDNNTIILVYLISSNKKINWENSIFKNNVVKKKFFVSHDMDLYTNLSRILNDIKVPYLITLKDDNKVDIIATLSK
jgi:hypothetical protein